MLDLGVNTSNTSSKNTTNKYVEIRRIKWKEKQLIIEILKQTL